MGHWRPVSPGGGRVHALPAGAAERAVRAELAALALRSRGSETGLLGLLGFPETSLEPRLCSFHLAEL